jgi:Zn-dependent peptidase ImmA (M78 family)
MIVDLVAGMKKEYPGYKVETILREEGSDILRLPMGTSSNAIKGFLQKNNRCYITVVNSDLNENIQDKILFHELGHLVLKHAASSGNCLLADRSFSYRRDDSQIAHLENEANFFAAEYMLDTKKTLRTIHEYDLASAAAILRVPLEFLDYKLRLLHQTKRLETYRNCFAVSSDFLRKMKMEGLIID